MDYLKHTFACNKLGLYDGCHFVIEQFMSLSTEYYQIIFYFL